MIRLNPQFLRNLSDRQRRRSLEDRRERAFVLGIEMLDQHEAHARIDRQVRQQFCEGFESAGGGADADDRERTRWAGRVAGLGGRLCFTPDGLRLRPTTWLP